MSRSTTKPTRRKKMEGNRCKTTPEGEERGKQGKEEKSRRCNRSTEEGRRDELQKMEGNRCKTTPEGEERGKQGKEEKSRRCNRSTEEGRRDELQWLPSFIDDLAHGENASPARGSGFVEKREQFRARTELMSSSWVEGGVNGNRRDGCGTRTTYPDTSTKRDVKEKELEDADVDGDQRIERIEWFGGRIEPVEENTNKSSLNLHFLVSHSAPLPELACVSNGKFINIFCHYWSRRWGYPPVAGAIVI
ncbi:hypothetical protein B0H19DRAFT_1066896 [Mycena capillaripes]|nr:hypothetical protein B0H19DRAFT_1066896 [Mycena capillaripes]